MMEMEKEKITTCSQCGKAILKDTEKCEHCGSWFSGNDNPSNSFKCKSCGRLIEEENAYFCPECGRKIRRKNIITRKLKAFDVEHERNAWPKRLSISLVIWGVVNLLVASTLFEVC